VQVSPVLIPHVAGGIAGLVFGAAAISFRKGSRRHAIAGTIFLVSMLVMSVCGIYLAIVKSKFGDTLGGTLTAYLVATAWMTARRRNGRSGVFDGLALAIVLGLAAVIVTFGAQAALSPTGTAHGYPPGVYIFLCSVTLAAAAGDIRMLARGVSGTRRIARHLWRMCFALFIASASIFLARQRLFPAILRDSGALYVLTALPLVLMIYWLIRIRMSKARSNTWMERKAVTQFAPSKYSTMRRET
jgi:uncharacterized membrane protein